MRHALTAVLACFAAAACASSPSAVASDELGVSPAPDSAHTEADAGGAVPAGGAASIAELRCLTEPLPERVRVRFDVGHTGRDLAVWYATTACRRVEAPRALLARATLTQVDALARGDDLLDLFNSLLRGLGLLAVEHGDGVAIVAKAAAGEGAAPVDTPLGRSDRIVLAPSREQESEAP
jgi:hypothetical protein